MKTILATFLTILMLMPVSAMGEILTIKHTVRQTFGGGQSPDDARISGIALAKSEALEKAGTYIESLTVVKNAQVEGISQPQDRDVERYKLSLNKLINSLPPKVK